MTRRASILVCVALVFTACGHAPPAGEQTAPVVAVVTPSAPADAHFSFRHRIRLDLEEMRLDRGEIHRGEILEAVRGAEVARLSRAGYRLAPEAGRGEAEAALAGAARLDRATLRRALQADLLLLTTVREWDEPSANELKNAVTVSIEVSLHDLRDGHLVWRNRIRGLLVRTLNDLDDAPDDLARAAVAEAMRALPAP